MKKLIYPLFGLLALASCKKAPIKAVENGCISQVGVPELSGADSITIAGLMKSNNLPTTNLVFDFYETYNTMSENNQMVDVQIGEAAYMQNGLELFFYDESYGFQDGTLMGPSPLNPVTVSLDNKPTLPLQTLRDSFINEDKGMEYDKSVALGLKDSCLAAQLGYYNINISTGKGASFVKAWYVHPKNSQWPKGYFRDDSGAAILFRPLTSSGAIP